ncbi:MAG: CopG family ribbon-helix-helix protein [Promethearchaeota archaeon]
MDFIPIISISINEGLKKFINKLVDKNKYENKSKLIRDALLRLMSSEELANSSVIDFSQEFFRVQKKITGNMIIVIPNNSNVVKKLNKIENEFKEYIISKNQYFNGSKISIFLVFEGSIEEFQKIVGEINSINELSNFRYLIIN